MPKLRAKYDNYCYCPLCAYTDYECSECPYYLKYKKTCLCENPINYCDTPLEFAKRIMEL
jgi:hypothetical protein